MFNTKRIANKVLGVAGIGIPKDAIINGIVVDINSDGQAVVDYGVNGTRRCVISGNGLTIGDKITMQKRDGKLMLSVEMQNKMMKAAFNVAVREQMDDAKTTAKLTAKAATTAAAVAGANLLTGATYGTARTIGKIAGTSPKAAAASVVARVTARVAGIKAEFDSAKADAAKSNASKN